MISSGIEYRGILPSPDLDVVVLGLGRSGVAAATLLLDLGIQPVLLDDDPSVFSRETVQKLIARNARLGEHLPSKSALLIVSPGIPSGHMILQEALDRGIDIWSELELGTRCCAAPILAVTGSDGKSTTCALAAHALQSAGFETILAGNIGTPFTSVAQTIPENGFAVVEVSSYQLEQTGKFPAKIACLLNIAPDHLARHGSMETYAAVKGRIFSLQKSNDWRVINRDQEELIRLLPPSASRVLGFSMTRSLAAGAWLSGPYLVQRRKGGKEIPVLECSDLTLPGSHNIANALAVLAMLLPLEIDVATLARGILTFNGLPHRLESVGSAKGVHFVNDSKATNVHSATRGLRSFEKPVILLAGGADKGLSFEPLRRAAEIHARMVITFGDAGGRIARELSEVTEIRRSKSLEDAVTIAVEMARSGDVVLLSPACSSFDVYESFEARGDHFRQLVTDLAGFSPDCRHIMPQQQGNTKLRNDQEIPK